MFYLSNLYLSQARPFINDVIISESQIYLGSTFRISVTAGNEGDNADMQIVSVSFPNFTSGTNNFVRIINSNFTQKPLLVKVGDQIGSNYQGLGKTISAKFPSIQFYSRPWKNDVFYNAQLEIRPLYTGKFVLLLKAVALPYIDSSSHYPHTGIRDNQQENVKVYYVNVVAVKDG